MTPDRCTCQSGRASDGSEHGPCAWCEEMAWRAENGPCETCGGSGELPASGWPHNRPCPECALTDEEREAWMNTRNEMNK